MALKTLKDLVKNFNGNKEIAIIERTGYQRFVYSYDALYDRAKRFAAFLHENQIRKGDRIIIWSYNGIEWVTVLCGSILAGIIIIPVDLRSTIDFIEKIQKDVNAKAIFQTRYKPKIRNIKTIFMEDLEYNLEEIQSRGIKDIEISINEILINENDLAGIVYTSGTIGTPKGVLLTHRNIVSNIKGLNQIKKIDSSYKFLSLLPLSHMFEQTAGFFIPASNSAKIVYIRALKASAILEAFQEEKINVTLIVPGLLKLFHTVIKKKIKEQGKEKSFNKAAKLASHFPSLKRILFYQIHKIFGGKLQYFVCGGAPLDSELEEFFDSIGIPIVQGYGLTETSPILTANLPEKKKKGSVGKALPNVKLKINPDGEILAKGPIATKGYYKNIQSTLKLFENGWLKTGDIGYIDNEGYLFLKGRKKDVIKSSGGLPVYADDIESILNKISGVKDSAVISLPTERGEKVHAVILLEKGKNRVYPEKIIKEANAKLAQHQQIISYDLWPFEDFPRTPTLKIKKFVIKDFIVKKEIKSVKPSEIVEKRNKIYEIMSLLTNKNIAPDSTLKELGLSSIDSIELVSLLEQEFHIDIDEEKILPITKVKDLEQLVKRRALIKSKRLFKSFPLFPPSLTIRFIFQQIIFFPFVRFFSWPSIEGTENLKSISKPVIFASNHQSYLDLPLILMKLPLNFQKTATAAWQEYFFTSELKYKSFSKWLLFYLLSLFFNIYPFSQKKEFKRAMSYTGKLLERNWNILIFPEGERERTNELLPFKQGIGILIVEMKVLVVPIKIEGALKVLPRWKKFPSFGKVRIKIGKPIYIKTSSYIEATEMIEKAVREL